LTTKIYLGGPLFNEKDLDFNKTLENKIKETYQEDVEIYNPMNNQDINDKSQFAGSKDIAQGDNKHLEESDILIAQLDGQPTDVGLAAETGYFYSFDRPILGLYTDTRQGHQGNQDKIDAMENTGENQTEYINLYLTGLIKTRGEILTSVDDLVKSVGKHLNKDK